MVAAAFIGPGTVTTATLAGTTFGYTLLWAILFSVLTTCILQEMAARLGVVTQSGLGEALRKKVTSRLGRIAVMLLVIAAIFIGNAAYEAGNIAGVALGVQLSFPASSLSPGIPLFIAFLAGILLFLGTYRWIERLLVGLVALMGFTFLSAAFLADKDLWPILHGLFVPSIPENAGLAILGLIGTTVVPYNLFLHAAAASERWKHTSDLPSMQWDTLLSILFGGVITLAIVIVAASLTGGSEPLQRAHLADQLRPLLGTHASLFVGVGFMAAGLSSAITAPLAAAYASTEILGLTSDKKSRPFRMAWGLVLLTGFLFSTFPAYTPETIILFAQFANGLLLPVIALLLLWVMSDKQLLGDRVNTPVTNGLGLVVLLVTLLLGVKSILSVLNLV